MSAVRLPRPVRALLRAWLPVAEREEVLLDLEHEYQRRTSTDGTWAARRWVWRQGLGSMPALVKRTWWRGMTGFEPRANRLRPGGPMFETWIMDARYAVRRLISRPVYAVLAVLTLALGAGGTAAIFSVVRTLLLDPLPIAREGEVGVLWFDGSWSEAEFAFLRPEFPGFQRMAAYRPDDTTIEMPGGQLRLAPGIASTAELFDVLRTAPMLGRGFQQGDDAPGAEPSTVISYSLWQELGADRGIIGRPIRLGGVPRTVIGVMPAGFWFPSPETKVWSVIAVNPQNRSGQYTLVGRVADGLDLTQLDGQLQSMAARVGEQFPAFDHQWDKRKNPEVVPAREFLIGDVRPSLLATLAAMTVILLIACGNVAALMLGQVDAQATEMAVRSALGASRQRLVQQLVFESIVIGAGAGLMGGLLALGGFHVLVGSLPLGELAATARLDWTVFWASILAALVAAVVIAIVPGAVLWRGSSLRSSMAATRTGGISGRGGRLEGSLVIAQMALAVLLAAGAGLLIRSVANLRAIDPGVGTEGVLLVEAAMPTRMTGVERRRAILDALPALASLPGVASAGAAQRVPLSGASGDNWGIRVVGKPDLPQSTTAFRMVTRDYLTTLGMPLIVGRSFGISDREGSERVVVINQALADKYFAGEDPLGRRLQTFDAEGERIIGVVANAAEALLTDAPVPARYMLYEHVPPVRHQVTFVLRTGSDSLAGPLLESARGVIEGRNSLAVQSTTTMGARFDRAIGPAGQVVTLLTLLAGLALVLGAVGVYGVISHYVTRRTRDYGLRLALGQPPSAIVRQVVARGASLVALGAGLGVVSALFVTRVLATLLYGVESTDPLALMAAVLLLLAVGVVAAFVPARRASLTDPALVLRQ